MATFVLAFVVIAISLAGLAVGILAGRSPLAGGCGRGACRGCKPSARRLCHRERGEEP